MHAQTQAQPRVVDVLNHLRSTQALEERTPEAVEAEKKSIGVNMLAFLARLLAARVHPKDAVETLQLWKTKDPAAYALAKAAVTSPDNVWPRETLAMIEAVRAVFKNDH